jgi:16S rRNA (cytosine1402-N4)-methyltransferase
VKSNFRYLINFLKYYNIEKVDGILADLGVSFHHFDETERGFSFRFDGKLDMRMNQNSTLTAEKVLNEYEEEDLSRIFYLYGEIHQSRKIASAIVKARNDVKIETTGQLVEIVKPYFSYKNEKKDMARLFQSLRIEVNKEMKVLQEFLVQTIEVLNPQGRLVVLTYHSLEDRIVKNFMRSGNI